MIKKGQGLFIFIVCGGGGLIAKSCSILCDPMDCTLSDSSVHWILQARILEWVSVSSSIYRVGSLSNKMNFSLILELGNQP